VFFKGLDTGLEFVHILLRKSFPLVGKDLMELDGKEELRIILHLPYPGPGHPDSRGPVKGAVYFDDINIESQKDKGMKTGRFFRRIDNTFPVLVAPACGSDEILRHLDLLYIAKARMQAKRGSKKICPESYF
jgi:hypothetical protein